MSVLIPMYNHRDYIETALASVVSQNYRPLEIIAIDDGSRDDTAAIARAFLERHMPSAVVLQRPNRGAAQTINQAMTLSNGQFINILNSDDFFAPGRIAKCVETAIRTGREFLYTGVQFVDDLGQIAAEDDYIRNLRATDSAASAYPSLGFALMRNQLAISTGNFFFSRRLADRIGPFQSYRYVHDWDYILRALFYTEPYALPDLLYNYRFHGENSFKSLAHIASYETTEIMRNFLWSMVSRYPENARAPSPHLWPHVFEHYIREWNYQVYLPPRFWSGCASGERLL